MNGHVVHDHEETLLRTRLLALAAAAPLLMLAGAVGSPASATPGPNCGDYPAGQKYEIRASTNHSTARTVTVPKGTTVSLTARVLRNKENCSGRRVSFFVHGPGEFNADGSSKYHLTGQATTDADGIAILKKTAVNNFRWYAGYTSDNGTGTVSSKGADRLVQVTG
jgi:hypothetical protein